ncbi:uncharacterized protein LOC124654127 isoform X2 [Lolium rigidum]|uniref:uncharacterized protein LOC124654127 isoform X2 n=1 Tax=Lolium rigidum TaxID=89674 RepID=UPI001F5CFCE1|nr:uncharacterized protein LOC124654127 isoform X2 [Lolium rigidum]
MPPVLYVGAGRAMRSPCLDGWGLLLPEVVGRRCLKEEQGRQPEHEHYRNNKPPEATWELEQWLFQANTKWHEVHETRLNTSMRFRSICRVFYWFFRFHLVCVAVKIQDFRDSKRNYFLLHTSTTPAGSTSFVPTWSRFCCKYEHKLDRFYFLH